MVVRGWINCIGVINNGMMPWILILSHLWLVLCNEPGVNEIYQQLVCLSTFLVMNFFSFSSQSS